MRHTCTLESIQEVSITSMSRGRAGAVPDEYEAAEEETAKWRIELVVPHAGIGGRAHMGGDEPGHGDWRRRRGAGQMAGTWGRQTRLHRICRSTF